MTEPTQFDNEEKFPYDPNRPTQSSMNTEAIKMGALMALLLIGYSLILQYTGMIQNRGLGSISFVLIMLGLFLGVKNYRDTYLEGWITFGQAFNMGFRILLYASIIYAVYTYVFLKFIDYSQLIEARRLAEEEILNNPDLSEEAVEQALNFSRKYILIPGTMAILAFFSNLLIGSILAVINAALLKRNRLPEES